ncbi:SpoIIAA family protein [Maribrevibacterium harenarium]|nr:STAS/SEC14 domain-containing protein [Maribrevibacterium harenarium]
MFTVKQVGDNRLEVHLIGSVNRSEMDTALDVLIRASETMEQGTMLYIVKDFAVPELPALVSEIAKIPALLRAMHSFERIAVVADEAWVRKVSEIKGALMPSLEIKAFTPAEVEIAEQWLDALPIAS